MNGTSDQSALHGQLQDRGPPCPSRSPQRDNNCSCGSEHELGNTSRSRRDPRNPSVGATRFTYKRSPTKPPARAATRSPPRINPHRGVPKMRGMPTGGIQRIGANPESASAQVSTRNKTQINLIFKMLISRPHSHHCKLDLCIAGATRLHPRTELLTALHHGTDIYLNYSGVTQIAPSGFIWRSRKYYLLL